MADVEHTADNDAPAERFCADHSRGVRHDPHNWTGHYGEGKTRKVEYRCPGSTLGRYASREAWRASVTPPGVGDH